MRAWKFAKIDYIKTKQQMVMVPLLLLVVVIIMGVSKDGHFNGATLFCYMVFMMTIFSTQVFGVCSQQESGFLCLLPADTRDRVAGRFLHGLSLMCIAAVMGIGAQIVYRMLGYEADSLDAPFCMVGFAIGLIIMTAEYVFFYLFGENQGQHLIGLVRTLPGMCLFFISANLSSELAKQPDKVVTVMQSIGSHLMLLAWVILALSIVIYFAAVKLCIAVIRKRDY